METPNAPQPSTAPTNNVGDRMGVVHQPPSSLSLTRPNFNLNLNKPNLPQAPSALLSQALAKPPPLNSVLRTSATNSPSTTPSFLTMPKNVLASSNSNISLNGSAHQLPSPGVGSTLITQTKKSAELNSGHSTPNDLNSSINSTNHLFNNMSLSNSLPVASSAQIFNKPNDFQNKQPTSAPIMTDSSIAPANSTGAQNYFMQPAPNQAQQQSNYIGTQPRQPANPSNLPSVQPTPPNLSLNQVEFRLFHKNLSSLFYLSRSCSRLNYFILC